MGRWDLPSLIYEPHYLTAQSSGGVDALVLLMVVWATAVLITGLYLTAHSSRPWPRFTVHAGYWVAVVLLAICRATGSAPLASPLWAGVSLLSGMYILGDDLLTRSPRSESKKTLPDVWLRRGAFALLAFTLAWAASEYFRHRTTGVIGSDPFCYVQMAVDFARHGTFAHRFPLTAQVVAWGLPPGSALPVCYWLPGEPDAAITSYPFGFPLLLATGYIAGGERALWLTTPLLALASVGATWMMAQMLFSEEPLSRRQITGAVAAWIVATSYTQMRLSIVPMSDVPAQLFSTLALALTLAAEHRRQTLFSALGGIALGMAYLIRHTALALLAPLTVILALSRPARKGWWQRQLTLGLAAVFVALPDMLYHQKWLGAFWRSENPEIGRLAGAGHVGASVIAFVKYLMYPGEFGWLLPLMFVGASVLWRKRRDMLAVLMAWILALAAIYAPVHTTALFQNGARYMVPAFPALALVVGFGVASILEALPHRRWITHGVVVALALPFILRTPLHKPLLAQYPTFGYLSPSQRAEFDALRQTIPAGAVVLCGDADSGPLFWHTGSAVIRPSGWTEDEFVRFIAGATDRDMPVYLLDDGALNGFVRNYPFQFVGRFAIGDPAHPAENLYLWTSAAEGSDF